MIKAALDAIASMGMLAIAFTTTAHQVTHTAVEPWSPTERIMAVLLIALWLILFGYRFAEEMKRK